MRSNDRDNERRNKISKQATKYKIKWQVIYKKKKEKAKQTAISKMMDPCHYFNYVLNANGINNANKKKWQSTLFQVLYEIYFISSFFHGSYFWCYI